MRIRHVLEFRKESLREAVRVIRGLEVIQTPNLVMRGSAKSEKKSPGSLEGVFRFFNSTDQVSVVRESIINSV